MPLYENVGEFTPEEQRMNKLLDSMEPVHAFRHEGRMYLGYLVNAATDFIKNNPFPADFSVWLQDNYKELK